MAFPCVFKMEKLILSNLQEGALPSASSMAPSPPSTGVSTSLGIPANEELPAPSGGLGSLFLPLAIMFGFVWLFILRPERKRQKTRAAMLSAIGKGDKVVTVGGMHGEVVRLEEKTVTVKVSDNLRLKFDRSAIARPASSEAGDPASAEITEASAGG
ncbi:MAG: preprotein translocase subunit YajC [Planctomycetes bacterium]|nr:preprotein translocase subunit YajC [Planctomycetota bacterium]